MLFETLKKMAERNHVDDALMEKIDLFYALGKLTKEQYEEIIAAQETEG